MSKIEELIQQLCPDGVEYKELSEIAYITIGEFVHKNKQNVNGKYPVYNGGISYTGFYDEYNNTANKIVISARGANAGFVNKVTVDYWAGNSCYSISFKEIFSMDWIFVFYFMKQNESKLTGDQQKGGIPAVSKKMVEKFQIPVPPLPIQQEIVSILDKFTTLEAELEAELEARRAQYNFYRNQLLNFEGKEVEWKTLGEVCNVQSGGTPAKNNTEYWNGGTIKWLGSTVCKNKKGIDEITDFITEEGLKKSSAKIFKRETTLIALVGATIGKVAYLPFEATTNQNVAGLYPLDTNILNTSYLFYSCKALYDIFTNLSQDKLKMANLSFVRALKIPIPPIEEQERIAGILDKFDALVNDILVGLPAEIAARRKQYEYYREKLLNFKSITN